MSTIDIAKSNLESFIEQYKQMNESDKFAMGKIFREATGGKLSPYNSPQPVAVALIPVETSEGIRLIAGRRGIAPKIGELALPGGFFDANEHGQEAAAREVFEEVGLKLDASLFKSHHIPMTSPTNNTLIFFAYSQVLDEEMLKGVVLDTGSIGSGEMSEFVLIDQNTPLAFPFHEQAVKAFFDLALTNENSDTNLKQRKILKMS